MVLFVALLFIIGFAAMIPIVRDAGPTLEAQLDAKALAQELTVWHVAASRSCVTGCADGPILNAPDFLPVVYVGKGGFADGTLHSFVSGEKVYSFYASRNPGSDYSNVTYAGMSAAMFDFLRKDALPYVGRYVAATGTMSTAGLVYNYYSDQTGSDGRNGAAVGTAVSDIVVPAGLAGASIPDGAPVIATNSNFAAVVSAGSPVVPGGPGGGVTLPASPVVPGGPGGGMTLPAP